MYIMYIYISMYLCIYVSVYHIYIYICVSIYLSIYLNIYIYIYMYMNLTYEGFLEVAKESWSEWDLNPRTMNSVHVQML